LLYKGIPISKARKPKRTIFQTVEQRENGRMSSFWKSIFTAPLDYHNFFYIFGHKKTRQLMNHFLPLFFPPPADLLSNSAAMPCIRKNNKLFYPGEKPLHPKNANSLPVG